jgi:hypothetical protein
MPPLLTFIRHFQTDSDKSAAHEKLNPIRLPRNNDVSETT